MEIELDAVIRRITNIGYTIKINDGVKDFLAIKGYDIQFGARPLKRAIQNYIEDGLGEMIINGEVNHGDTILIDKTEDKEELTFSLQSCAS